MHNNIFLKIYLLFLLMICMTLGKAEVKLSNIFGNYMVLQQKTDAAIWGKASGAKVTVVTSWNNKSYSVFTDKQGYFKLKIKTPEAGGPYEITLSDGEELTLHDVLIGEVWFCCGQSNMQMKMKGKLNQPVFNSNYSISHSANSSIRLFSVGYKKSLTLLDNFSQGEKWEKCIPENVSNFSATAYYFGKNLQEVLGVPVGLIVSSVGGTRIEPWMSAAAVKTFNFLNLPDEKIKGDYSVQTPTCLFNAMVNPLIDYAIKGIIWYQGDSNRGEPERFAKLLPALIKDWRVKWGLGDFPFYFAQLAPFSNKSGNAAFLREAQLKASSVFPNVGMACLMDNGESYCTHPSHKEVTGERLAYLAFSGAYGMKGIVAEGPTLKDITINGNIVKMTFNNAPNGLTSYGKKLMHFKVAGKNKKFYPAKAVITHQGITLTSSDVDKIVAVRYAFDDYVKGDLFNTYGIPASCFRTDNWEK